MKRRLSDVNPDVRGDLIVLLVTTFVETGEKAKHTGAEASVEIRILFNFIFFGKSFQGFNQKSWIVIMTKMVDVQLQSHLLVALCAVSNQCQNQIRHQSSCSIYSKNTFEFFLHVIQIGCGD